MISQKDHHHLEWPLLLKQLASLTTSSVGQQICLKLEISTDFQSIQTLQLQTQDMRHLIESEGDIPLGGIRNLYPLFEQIQKGRILTPHQFLDIFNVLKATVKIKSFGLSRIERDSALHPFFSALRILDELHRKIDITIHPDGTVLDSASVKLSEIRLKLRQLQEKVQRQLKNILIQKKHIFHDPMIVQRQDRYVLPVKAGAQGELKGLIHEQSASGATLYVEPLSILGDNNALRRIFSQEKAEIDRILIALTGEVEQCIEPLKENLDQLAQLDSIYAKARYSIKLKGVMPQISSHPDLNLQSIRHPLLIGQLGFDEVVPMTIHCPPHLKTVIITGPNTGGKTVTLKTIGLAALMAQCGLQLPAQEAKLPVFDKVLAVIGDEQSLTHNLSTFSAHLHQLKMILKAVSKRSLILIDEIATGTDPLEGSALARAVLNNLTGRGCKTVVSTHYSNLTTMAAKDQRIQNASVAFDVEELKPLYHLHQGQPGRSHGLHIAERLGIRENILKQARQWLGSQHQSVDSLLAKLESQRLSMEEERQQVQLKLSQLAQEQADYQKKLEVLENERLDLKDKAQRELNQDIASAHKLVTQLTRELQSGVTMPKVQKIREQILDLDKKVNPPPPPIKTNIDINKLVEGSKVYYSKLQQYGELLTLPDKQGMVTILCNQFKLTVSAEELVLSSVRKEKKGDTSGISLKVVTQASQECYVRQMQIHEALPVIEKHLDQAFTANLSTIYIVHGKGEGVLKDAVHDYLKESPYVKSYRIGGPGEGENGVTVVTLS